VTKYDVRSELARELSMRRNVFPKWVAAGKLDQEEAARRIARMQAAYDFILEAMPEDYRPKTY
jgi:cell division FtsZ-interacting protein ZapD